MTKGHLEKRISNLESTGKVDSQPSKVFLTTRYDLNERLHEIEKAKAAGYETMNILLCGPEDELEDSEWGEYLRSREAAND